MATRRVRNLIVPIFDTGGNPYTSDNDGKAILIYAKKRTLVVALPPPYDNWEDDSLVGGTFELANLDHLGNGIWKYVMDPETLDADNEDREDYYFVKTGTATGYTGTAWTMVGGYDPVSFGTYNITPKAVKNMLAHLDYVKAMDWDLVSNLLVDGKIPTDMINAILLAVIESNSTHRESDGSDHSLISNINIRDLIAAMAINDSFLNALSNKLQTSTPLAENIAALS